MSFISPPKKYGRKQNKFWEKQFWGIFRWRKKNIKKYKPNFKKKKRSKDTHEYKYSLF